MHIIAQFLDQKLFSFIVDDPWPCGGQLPATEAIQQFATPGYPIVYYRLLNCSWVITAPVGYRVTLTFVDWQVDGGCVDDTVSIHDGMLLCHHTFVTRLT